MTHRRRDRAALRDAVAWHLAGLGVSDASMGIMVDLLRDAIRTDTRPTNRAHTHAGGNMKQDDDDGRDTAGRFTTGNPGGPGRPRRAVEGDYLRALTDRLTPDAWGAIVDTAIDDARAGDAKAREWLARYVLGDRPPSLFSLAVADAAGDDADVDAEIRHVVARARADAVARMIADTERPPVVMLGPHIRDAG